MELNRKEIAQVTGKVNCLQKLPKLSPQIEKFKEQLGTITQYLERFNPTSVQDGLLRARAGFVECKSYDLPTLEMSAQIYGEKAIVVWIKIQLENLNEYCGVKEKMSLEQLSEVSKIIFYTYPQLNIAEIAFFILKFKSGYFGQFYGCVDPLKISSAFCQFMLDRMDALNAAQRDSKRQEIEWSVQNDMAQKLLKERIIRKRKKIMSIKKIRIKRIKK